MTEERCEKHDMLLNSCFDCKPPSGDITYWDAKYEGICGVSTCLKIIEVGDRVTWNREGTHVIHAKHRGH